MRWPVDAACEIRAVCHPREYTRWAGPAYSVIKPATTSSMDVRFIERFVSELGCRLLIYLTPMNRFRSHPQGISLNPDALSMVTTLNVVINNTMTPSEEVIPSKALLYIDRSRFGV